MAKLGVKTLARVVPTRTVTSQRSGWLISDMAADEPHLFFFCHTSICKGLALTKASSAPEKKADRARPISARVASIIVRVQFNYSLEA